MITSRWNAIGTSIHLASVGVSTVAHAELEALARGEIEAMDETASRFRADSEVRRLRPGWSEVSPLLASTVQAALRAAQLTDGLVVPTLGRQLGLLGYDADLAVVRTRGEVWDAAAPTPAPSPWTDVVVDPAAGRLFLPVDVELDLGATAKALLADRIAAQGAALLRSEGAAEASVLINLGGDCAVATTRGAATRWQIAIDDSDRPDPTRSAPAELWISGGGLATSSTRVRRWRRSGVERHHIIDPRTGRPAGEYWRCVSVLAGSCLDANAASTAAIVLGPQAPGWLAAQGLRARLVGAATIATPGWPGRPQEQAA